MSFLTNFITKYENKNVNWGGLAQCMALANRYRNDLTGLDPDQGINLFSAWQIYAEPKGFFNSATKYERIENQPDNYPNAGDIIIWNKNQGQGNGHVAIVTRADVKSFGVFEQNTGNGDGEGYDDRSRINSYPDYSDVMGWLRILPTQYAQEQVLVPASTVPVRVLEENMIVNIKEIFAKYKDTLALSNDWSDWARANTSQAQQNLEPVYFINDLLTKQDNRVQAVLDQKDDIIRENTLLLNDKTNLMQDLNEAENIKIPLENKVLELENNYNNAQDELAKMKTEIEELKTQKQLLINENIDLKSKIEGSTPNISNILQKVVIGVGNFINYFKSKKLAISGLSSSAILTLIVDNYQKTNSISKTLSATLGGIIGIYLTSQAVIDWKQAPSVAWHAYKDHEMMFSSLDELAKSSETNQETTQQAEAKNGLSKVN
jgi:hypothetical protein